MNVEGELSELKMRMEMLTAEKRDLQNLSTTEPSGGPPPPVSAPPAPPADDDTLFDNVVDDSLFDNVMDLNDLGQLAFDDLHQLLEDDSVAGGMSPADPEVTKSDIKTEFGAGVAANGHGIRINKPSTPAVTARLKDIDCELHTLNQRIRIASEKSNELRQRQQQQRQMGPPQCVVGAGGTGPPNGYVGNNSYVQRPPMTFLSDNSLLHKYSLVSCSWHQMVAIPPQMEHICPCQSSIVAFSSSSTKVSTRLRLLTQVLVTR